MHPKCTEKDVIKLNGHSEAEIHVNIFVHVHVQFPAFSLLSPVYGDICRNNLAAAFRQIG